MGYEKLLDPLGEMRESCEALLAGEYGALTGDARESVKNIYGGTGGLYALFIDIITSLGIENTARRAFLQDKFQDMLRLVNSNSRALLDEMDGPLSEEQQVSVIFISETGEMLSRYVESIWLYSRLHLNHVKVNRTSVDISKLATKLKAPAVDRPVKSTIFADEPVPVAVTDEKLLRRCLQELINNAAKFSTDGMIIVHCRLAQNAPVIDVIDTGRGITTVWVERLFEPFYQEDVNAEGIGLGLTIAGQIARLLHGRIELTDSRSGIGSTFSIFLPAA
jgi:two-component system, sensor histidine kinase ChiS